jgi:hypothetical protein
VRSLLDEARAAVDVERIKADKRHGRFPFDIDLVIAGMRAALERANSELGGITAQMVTARLIRELDEK